MIQSGKIKNVGIFLAIFVLILGISLGGLNFGFTLVSFAQETGEIIETENTQETPATEEVVGAKDTEKTEEAAATAEEEAEEEEELDISLIAEYITYEKIDEEDLIIAKEEVEFKYQDIEIKADYLKINLDTIYSLPPERSSLNRMKLKLTVKSFPTIGRLKK